MSPPGTVEAKLQELGLVLPEPMQPPPGVRIPFAFARVAGERVYIAGHGPQAPDGSFAFEGKVGADVSPEEAYAAARLTALSILGTLKRQLGDLDRVNGWLRVFGMVNSLSGKRPQAGDAVAGVPAAATASPPSRSMSRVGPHQRLVPDR